MNMMTIGNGNYDDVQQYNNDDDDIDNVQYGYNVNGADDDIDDEAQYGNDVNDDEDDIDDNVQHGNNVNGADDDNYDDAQYGNEPQVQIWCEAKTFCTAHPCLRRPSTDNNTRSVMTMTMMMLVI